jgi:Tfp pilus assembly protein PilF
MQTREEHLKWCKQRAMEYVKAGDYQQAVASMLSDLRTHPENAPAATGICAQLGIMELMNGPTRESITRYIEGFN